MVINSADKRVEKPSLSVFMPVYNEEGNIRKTIEDADKVLKGLPLKNYEIIAVNDGSKDKTESIIRGLQKKYKNLRLVNHGVNKGYGEAIRTGFLSSKYGLVCFIDSDGQFDLSEVTKFLEEIKRSDVVVGFRMDRQDPLIRKINGWGWTMIANVLLGLRVKDVDCAFKLFKKDVLDSIQPLESTRGGMINPEVLAKIVKGKYKIKEVGVHHFSRTSGEQTGANFKVILNSFKDLFSLWWRLK